MVVCEVLIYQQQSLSCAPPLSVILWEIMPIQRYLPSFTFNSDFQSWSGRAAVPGGNTILFL